MSKFWSVAGMVSLTLGLLFGIDTSSGRVEADIMAMAIAMAAAGLCFYAAGGRGPN